MTIGTKKRSRSVYNTTKESGHQGGYECRTCNKRFDTFQALGGHQGTHKRVKLSDNNDACSLNLDIVVHKSSGLHRCKTCMKGFETGQALGGHMRRHRFEKALILMDKGRLWQQHVAEKVVESDLMLAAEKVVQSDLMLAAEKVNSDLMLAAEKVNSDLMLAAEKVESDQMLAAETVESDLMLVAVELQPLKVVEDKQHEVKSELVLAAKEWRLSV